MFKIEDKNNITVEFNSQKGGAAGVRNNAPLIFYLQVRKENIHTVYSFFKCLKIQSSLKQRSCKRADKKQNGIGQICHIDI